MKILFKLLGVSLFLGTMYMNLQQMQGGDLDSTSEATVLSLENSQAMASECVYWEGGVIVVNCSTWLYGCCYICSATDLPNGTFDTFCDSNGNPQDYCPLMCVF